MATVYILYSSCVNSYYIGSCKDFEIRLQEHISNKYTSGFTVKANDWVPFLRIDDLGYSQARNIEAHIKRMKSRKYIENLARFPDIINKLKLKYA